MGTTQQDGDRSVHTAYFDRVRGRLFDVPWASRQELLGDLSARLEALPPGTAPESVLGDPRTYSRLMRESAGCAPDPIAPFPYFRALRRRNKVLVFAIPIVIGLLAAAGVSWLHYEPLTANAYFDSSTSGAIPDPLANDVTYYRYQRGATVVTGMMLENSGRATVTVTGVEIADGALFGLTELRATRDESLGGQWGKAPRVDHLTLHPGERAELFVVMRMLPFAISPGGSAWGPQPSLLVQVLGVTHRVRPAGEGIGVAVPAARA